MGRIIDALMELQHERGYLDSEALHNLGERLRVPLYRLQELVSFYPHFRTTPPKPKQLALCRDVVCRMATSEAQRAELASLGARHPDVDVEQVSCLGRCDRAPAALVGEVPVSAADVGQLEAWLAAPPELEPARPSDRLFRCNPYGPAADHYGGLRQRLPRFDGSEVIAALKTAGLRGMGGAGFPTHLKWEMVARQPGADKVVICNADESEPCTFKDRVTLTELGHLVVEGMIVAGLAVGAERGIVFIRHEFAPEREGLAATIADARGRGLLGDDVGGSGRRFDLTIQVSPGGYILGEETALLECLEDRRGEPRNKPPFPPEHGLEGKPTLINNVETFAMVPAILRDAESWRDQGVGDGRGLKMVALSGDVERPGVYEVPMGTSLREVIALGGGVKDGRAVLAVAPGGASSGFVPGDRLDLPLDFDALAQAGSMLGSAALLVVAEGRDLLELATSLVTFFRNESCGKCVPCRIGSDKAVTLLEGARRGAGAPAHLPLLAELERTLAETSLCGLGQVALRPFSSALACDRAEVKKRFEEG